MSDPDIDHGPLAPEQADPALKPLTRDEQGRLILSREELANRGETFRRLMAEWPSMPDDDPPGAWEDVMRSMDADRPPGLEKFDGMS